MCGWWFGDGGLGLLVRVLGFGCVGGHFGADAGSTVRAETAGVIWHCWRRLRRGGCCGGESRRLARGGSAEAGRLTCRGLSREVDFCGFGFGLGLCVRGVARAFAIDS